MSHNWPKQRCKSKDRTPYSCTSLFFWHFAFLLHSLLLFPTLITTILSSQAITWPSLSTSFLILYFTFSPTNASTCFSPQLFLMTGSLSEGKINTDVFFKFKVTGLNPQFLPYCNPRFPSRILWFGGRRHLSSHGTLCFLYFYFYPCS